jgi:hypothetical protein
MGAPVAFNDPPDESMVAIYRLKTPGERLAIAFGLWQMARDVIVASIRSLHPEWPALRTEAEAARRMTDAAC